jgi:acetyltransferase-like isoleucine patch superfamily enzyme
MIKALKRFFWDIKSMSGRHALIECLLRDIPGGFGIHLRAWWYGKRFKKVGINLNVLPGTVIIHPENVECGDNVFIGYYNYLQAGGGLILGNDALLGPYVKIWTQNHIYTDPDIPVRLQGVSRKAVTVKHDVWIGANSFIMPGTVLGEKSIVSAGSVVGAKNYPEGIVLAGNPARKISARL